MIWNKIRNLVNICLKKLWIRPLIENTYNLSWKNVIYPLYFMKKPWFSTSTIASEAIIYKNKTSKFYSSIDYLIVKDFI